MDAVLEEKVSQRIDDIDIKKSNAQGPPPVLDRLSFDPGDHDSNKETGQATNNAFLAMLLFIGADVMFFAGLIGAFIIFRFGADIWPPAGQPRLPLGVTGVNTVILMFSGLAMARAWRLLKSWSRQKVIHGLFLTIVLGLVFLLVQGFEWIRLLKFGLTLSANVYGATFYTLIGFHGLHVFGAVVWLLVVLMRLILIPNSYGPTQTVGIKLIGMYWILVVVLWPVLYGLIYLS
ncbi:MAG: heme-copper oxidase subunit III [bacterium]